MTAESRRYIRRAANALPDAGATLIAGHSAHVFHGLARPATSNNGSSPRGRSADNRRRRLRNAPKIVSSGSTTIIAAEVEDGQFRS